MSALVEVARDYYLERFQRPSRLCRIEPIGQRLGEKMHGALINANEEQRRLELPSYYVILPPSDPSHAPTHSPLGLPARPPLAHCRYDSRDVPPMSRAELRNMIRQADESGFTTYDGK